MAEGVCGGIAKCFSIDVGIVRFIWLLLCVPGHFSLRRAYRRARHGAIRREFPTGQPSDQHRAEKQV